jgi:hypothetical protein
VVECFLAKEDVAGSTPVSRSKTPPPAVHSTSQFVCPASRAERVGCKKARYPSGKGEVCKTFMRRFDPGPRLQRLNDLASSLRARFVVWGIVGSACLRSPNHCVTHDHLNFECPSIGTHKTVSTS